MTCSECGSDHVVYADGSSLCPLCYVHGTTKAKRIAAARRREAAPARKPLPLAHETRGAYELRTGVLIHGTAFVALKAEARELREAQKNDGASALRRAFS